MSGFQTIHRKVSPSFKIETDNSTIQQTSKKITENFQLKEKDQEYEPDFQTIEQQPKNLSLKF